MLSRNVVFPSLMIILSAIAFVVIGQFAEPLYQEASVDAKFFPRVIVIAQIILCLALIIQSKTKQEPDSDDAPIFSKLSVFGLAYLVGYVALMSLVGYLIASIVAFVAYLLYFRVKKPLYYIVAISFVFGIYFLFGTAFLIVLPEGILL